MWSNISDGIGCSILRLKYDRYGAGLNMVAIIIIRDQICLHSCSKKGLNLLEMIISMRTLYGYNQFRRGLNMLAISNSTDHLCLHCLSNGPNMPTMSRMAPESRAGLQKKIFSRAYDFWTNLAKTNFRSLQAYLVPNERYCKRIRSFWNWDCKHI